MENFKNLMSQIKWIYELFQDHISEITETFKELVKLY